MDSDLHPYKRTFAWYKLLKLWGALRCHDAEGIPPASISYDPTTGFEADITPSKTTGAGRRVEVVQIFVSSSAYLVCRDWLRVGLEIFVGMGKEAGTGMRDYLMARPNHQLDGFRKSMMKYADAMAYSRALLAELPSRLVDGEGEKVPLLLPESTAYFSEHSERITMMSWAAVCGVEKEDRRRWGRWRPSVDEGYVTTTRRLTFEAQKTVAKRIRGTYGVHDLVDDMATVKHFTLWLQDVRKKVPSQANREAQPIAPPQWGMVHGRVLQPVEPEIVEDGGGSASAEGQEGPVQVDSPSVRSWSPTEIFSEEEDQNVDAADKGDEFPMGTFVLSVVGRSKARTLHVIGGCYRIPGVHYREYVVVGSERPDIDPKQGEKLCSTCFGAKEKMLEVIQAGAEAEVQSDLASSSSEEEGAAEASSAQADWRRAEAALELTARVQNGPGVNGWGLPATRFGGFRRSCVWVGRRMRASRFWFQPGGRVPSEGGLGIGGDRAMATDKEKVALLAPDLQGLVDARRVPESVQAGLYDLGIDNLAMLSVVAVDRSSLETLARSSLGVDSTARPSDAITFATLYLAWQSASKRMETKNEMDAEATAAKVPKAIPNVELQLFRAEYERRFFRLKDSECPGKPSFEDLCEQIDTGELRPMALRHFGSRNEDDEAETGNIQVGKTGILKIKKAKIETAAPANMEEFRSKIMLMINHFIFARFRYPSKQVLKDLNPFVAMEYLNYICSKDVAQLESQTVDGITLHRPSLKLIVGYEYQMRKEAVDEVNKGVELATALRQATKNPDIRQRHFSTPLAVSSASQSLQEPWKNRRNQERPHPYEANYQKGKGKSKGKSKKGKGKSKAGALQGTTPDGRQICFAWNNKGEGCQGQCGRVHCCRICMSPDHPTFEHPEGPKPA